MIFLVDILELVDRVRIWSVLLQTTLHCVFRSFDLHFVDVVEGVFADSERHHKVLTRCSMISRVGSEIRWRLLSHRSYSLIPSRRPLLLCLQFLGFQSFVRGQPRARPESCQCNP